MYPILSNPISSILSLAASVRSLFASEASCNEIPQATPIPRKRKRSEPPTSIPEKMQNMAPDGLIHTSCCQSPISDLRYHVANKVCSIKPEECRIVPNKQYYELKNHLSEETKDTICKTHFKKIRNKSNFEIKINENTNLEEILKCTECGDLWHRCCSLYVNDAKDFKCCQCAPAQKTISIQEYCKGSLHMERYLTSVLSERLPNPIKVVTFTRKKVVDTTCIAPANYLTKRFIAKYGKKITYHTRAIYVLQEQDGVHQLFFGMFCQEYENLWAKDKKSWFHIDFVDSVPYVGGVGMRRDFYGEILLAYMDYMRHIGFLHGHLYANPPFKGDDYVFNIHKSGQGYLGKQVLINWYKSIFDNGRSKGIVKDWKDCEGARFKEILDIPIMAGSLWADLMSIETTNYQGTVRNEERFKEAMNRQQKMHAHDNFFIELQAPDQLQTPDQQLFKCDGLDDKDDFHEICVNRNLEFFDERRARFSSVAFRELMRENLTVIPESG